MNDVPTIMQLSDVSKAVLLLAIHRAKEEGTAVKDIHLIKELISNKQTNIPSIIDKISNDRRGELIAKIAECVDGQSLHEILRSAFDRRNASYSGRSAAISPGDLLVAILTNESCVSNVMKNYGVSPHQVAKALKGESKGDMDFITDMTAKAAIGEYDPCIGMDSIMDRMMKTLLRKEKANPVLVGEPGVGKTSIVEGFAQRMAAGAVPMKLRDYTIYELSIGQMISNTTQRGMLEERLLRVLNMLSSKRAIVFIDEIHTVMSSYGIGPEIRDMMKPFLTGRVKVIGATTNAEYNQHIQRDAALERRFQPILVNEPDFDTACEIIEKCIPMYSDIHGVTAPKELVPHIVKLASRYNVTRKLPDSAFDILDESMATKSLVSCVEEETAARLRTKAAESFGKDDRSALLLSKAAEVFESRVGMKYITMADVNRATSMLCEVDIPNTEDEDLIAKIAKLESGIGTHLIGQEEAKTAIIRKLKANAIGLRSPERPIGCFMFLGPTGVGKTQMARALARALMGDEKKLQIFDMAEYSEKHTLSRLIGAPPGYVGYGAGGQLTERVSREKEMVIVFDEIEKAANEVVRVLLGLNENGYVTDGMGRKVTFRNCIIIATGNIGTGEISERMCRRMGFGSKAVSDEDEEQGRKRKHTIQQVKDRFNLEFVNRWDDIVVFKSLTRDELHDTVDVMLRDLYDGKVSATTEGKKALIDSAYEDELTSPDLYGARPVRRIIEDLIADEGFKFLAKNKETKLVITANEAGKPALEESNGSDVVFCEVKCTASATTEAGT